MEDTTHNNQLGQVIWFNSRKGFGFIEWIQVGEKESIKDNSIFVHITSIKSENNHKSLLQGEYVSFDVISKEEKYSAINVTGLWGRPLLNDNKEYSYRVFKKDIIHE